MRFETGVAKRESIEDALKVDAARNGMGWRKGDKDSHPDERIEKNPSRVIPQDVSDCPAIKVQFREYNYEMDFMIDDLNHEMAYADHLESEMMAYAS